MAARSGRWVERFDKAESNGFTRLHNAGTDIVRTLIDAEPFGESAVDQERSEQQQSETSAVSAVNGCIRSHTEDDRHEGACMRLMMIERRLPKQLPRGLSETQSAPENLQGTGICLPVKITWLAALERRRPRRGPGPGPGLAAARLKRFQLRPFWIEVVFLLKKLMLYL